MKIKKTVSRIVCILFVIFCSLVFATSSTPDAFYATPNGVFIARSSVLPLLKNVELEFVSNSGAIYPISVPTGTKKITAIYSEDFSTFWIWCSGDYNLYSPSQGSEYNLYRYVFDGTSGNFKKDYVVHMGSEKNEKVNGISSIIVHNNELLYMTEDTYSKYTFISGENWIINNKNCKYISQCKIKNEIYLLTHEFNNKDVFLNSTIYKIVINSSGEPFEYEKVWFKSNCYIDKMIPSKECELSLWDSNDNLIDSLVL